MPDLLSGIIPDDHVPVVDPDGELTSVPKAQWTEDLLKSGYRAQTPEEQKKFYVDKTYGEGFGPLKAGAAGAARALTLGASDVVAPELGVTHGTLKGLEQANPGASTTGEVVGTIAGLAVPGLDEASAPGLISKLGRGVEEAVPATTRLGKFAVKGLSGATEGALFGAGSAVSDNQLGDPNLNAEKLVSHVGLGALLGSAGGLFGEALDQAVEPISKKLSEAFEAAPSQLKRLATNSALNSMGKASGILRKISDEEKSSLFEVLRDNGIFDGTPNAKETLERITSLKNSTGKDIGKIFKDAHESGARPNTDNVIKALEDWKNGLGGLEQDAVESEVEKLTNILNKKQEAAGGLTESEREFLDKIKNPEAKAKILKEWGKLEATGEAEGLTFPELQKEKTSLQKKARWSMGELDNAQEGFAQPLKREMAGVFRDAIDQELMPQLGSDIAKALDDSRVLYGKLVKAEDIAQIGAQRLGVNTFDFLSGGYLAGMARLAGTPFAAVKGLIGGFGSKALRERSGPIIANIATKIAESPTLKTVAQGFAQVAQKAGQSGVFGEYAPQIFAAIGDSPEQGLATHIALAQSDPNYAQKAAMAGMPSEDPQDTKLALEKAHGLIPVKALIDQHDTDLKKGLSKALKGSGDPVPSGHTSKDFGAKSLNKDLMKSHDIVAKEVRDLAAQPDTFAQRIAANTGTLGKVAPSIAAGMASVASRAVTFLNSKLPDQTSRPLLAPEMPVTRQDAIQFARYAEAVKDPTKVLLGELASGTVNPETLEAIKAVHPTLYENSIKPSIINLLADRPKLPYAQRIGLALILDADIDGTMNPKFINSIQQTFIQQLQSQQGTPTATKADKITLAKRSKTALDASASREEV